MNTLRPYLIREFQVPFGIDYLPIEDHAWKNMFQIGEEVFMELTLEFVATFKYLSPETNEAIRFRLMGVWYDITLERFADLLGLYDSEFTESPGFTSYLSTSESGPFDEARCYEFFHSIANSVTHARDNRATQLRDPIHRTLHRLLTFTLCQSFGGDKVPNHDLLPLYGAINPTVRLNLPHLFALYFRDRACGTNNNSPIGGGNFVTRIAKNLVGISSSVRKRMVRAKPKLLEVSHFKNMFKKINGVYRFVDPDPVILLQGEHVPDPPRQSTSRRRQRTQEPSQTPQQEVNLGSISNQLREMELRAEQREQRAEHRARHLGEYLDDTNSFLGNFYHQFGYPPPPNYPYPTWNQRWSGEGPSGAHDDDDE